MKKPLPPGNANVLVGMQLGSWSEGEAEAHHLTGFSILRKDRANHDHVTVCIQLIATHLDNVRFIDPPIEVVRGDFHLDLQRGFDLRLEALETDGRIDGPTDIFLDELDHTRASRWTVRMAKDRKLFTPAQFEFSARALNECGRMVGAEGFHVRVGRGGVIAMTAYETR